MISIMSPFYGFGLTFGRKMNNQSFSFDLDVENWSHQVFDNSNSSQDKTSNTQNFLLLFIQWYQLSHFCYGFGLTFGKKMNNLSFNIDPDLENWYNQVFQWL